MAFTDPKENLKNLDIKDGWKVADFGTGSGFYALALSTKVGESGRVYAIDIQKDLLLKLKRRAEEDGVSNLEILWADIDQVGGSKLADSTMDAVVISNVLFQSENKENLVKEASRILKKGGQVLVIDWMDSYGGLGPEVSKIIKPEGAEEFFTKNGLAPERKFDAGDHHWGMVFKKL